MRSRAIRAIGAAAISAGPLLSCSGGAGRAEEPMPARPAADPPAPTLATPARPTPALLPAIPSADLPVDTWTREIRPLIEGIAGRPFTAETPVRSVTVDDLANVFGASIEREIRRARPDLIPVAARASAMSLAYAIAGLTLGVYSHEQHTILIVPTNIDRMARGDEIPSAHADRMLRLTIAHELVHALQDQHGSLTPPASSATSLEGRRAFTAVVEGHAVWVSRVLADRLGWAESEREIMRLALRGQPPQAEPELGGTWTAASFDPELAYRVGTDFVARQVELGGSERVWATLRTPPLNTEQVRSPDTYDPPPPAPK